MMNTDCIVTERLILRKLTEKDAKDVLALMSDDYTARMTGFRPISSIEEAIAFIDEWKGEYSFAVTERSDDRVIGIIQTRRARLSAFRRAQGQGLHDGGHRSAERVLL